MLAYSRFAAFELEADHARRRVLLDQGLQGLILGGTPNLYGQNLLLIADCFLFRAVVLVLDLVLPFERFALLATVSPPNGMGLCACKREYNEHVAAVAMYNAI